MALNTIQKQLVGDLFSNDQNIVIKSINQLKEDGSEEVLEPLIDLLVNTSDEIIKEEVKSLLNCIKNKNTVPIFINAINNPKYAIYKPELIAACWENGLDFSSYLSFFVDQAINEDYLVGIEAITVIETFNPPFNTEELNLNIVKLENAYKASEPMKQPMLQSLGKLLNDFLNMQ